MGVNLSQKRILLIDDSAEFRILVRKILETAGAVVIPVGSVREGLEVIKKSVPHLVLLDLSLGEESGFDFLKSYTEHQPGDVFPVVVVSSQGNFEAIKVSVALGASGYIVKPIKANSFLTKLRNIMDTFGTSKIVHDFAEPLSGKISIFGEVSRMSEVGTIVDSPIRLEPASTVGLNSKLLDRMGLPAPILKVERSGPADATGTYHGFLRFVGMDTAAINRVLNVIKMWPVPARSDRASNAKDKP